MKKITSEFIDRYLDSLTGQGNKSPLVRGYITQAIFATVNHFIGFEEAQEVPRQLNLYIILRKVSIYTGISIKDMKMGPRKKEIILARHYFYYLAKKNTDKTLENIADMLGFDHTTVLHGIKTISNNYDNYKNTRIDIDRLTAWILVQD